MRSLEELKALTEKVNDCWIAQNPEPGNCAWERAAYFLGNMAAFEVLGKRSYLDYAIRWADVNGWNFYDNGGFNTVNADNLLCGEIYMDLINKYGVPGNREPMLKTLQWTVQDSACNYWWWADALYMALPFYNRMGFGLPDDRLIEKAWRLFRNIRTERHCCDEEEGLWFRDENFLPDVAQTAGGRKVFWSRGNGWVLAGLARTLRTLPAGYRYYGEYSLVYRKMAEALRRCQSADGFWRTSLLEPEEFDMPESSGTALNVLGILIGIRQGLLGKEYLDCALRGFDALTETALDEEGRLGWVQAVALKPGPVERSCTEGYAVGTYLLICRELAGYQEGEKG